MVHDGFLFLFHLANCETPNEEDFPCLFFVSNNLDIEDRKRNLPNYSTLEKVLGYTTVCSPSLTRCYLSVRVKKENSAHSKKCDCLLFTLSSL